MLRTDPQPVRLCNVGYASTDTGLVLSLELRDSVQEVSIGRPKGDNCGPAAREQGTGS